MSRALIERAAAKAGRHVVASWARAAADRRRYLRAPDTLADSFDAVGAEEAQAWLESYELMCPDLPPIDDEPEFTPEDFL